MDRHPKRPRDVNQLAKLIIDEATGEPAIDGDLAPKNKRHVGGQKGGKARAAKLTTEERSKSARHAALKRWRG